ncbi:hypothetical protein TUM20249_19390 [Pseudomonas tohonis]|nr:hypothetical protein TUM20249_19390 [Pseudomonas tohonis]
MKKTMETICKVTVVADCSAALMGACPGGAGRGAIIAQPGGGRKLANYLSSSLERGLQIGSSPSAWQASVRCSIQARTAGSMPRLWV